MSHHDSLMILWDFLDKESRRLTNEYNRIYNETGRGSDYLDGMITAYDTVLMLVESLLQEVNK